MAYTLPDDILLPVATGAAERRPGQSRIAAFVPITIALIGVVAILFGRITVHEITVGDALQGLDPIATGSIEAASPVKADGNPGAQ